MNGLCWAKNLLSQRFSFSLTISEHHMGEAQQPRNCFCRRQSLAVRGVSFEVARDRSLASSLILTRNCIELPLKLKPEGHFLPYRCFGLWCSRNHPSWKPSVVNLHGNATHQWWIKTIWFWLLSCSLLLCLLRPVHLYLTSTARNVDAFTGFALCLCLPNLRLRNRNVFNGSSDYW